MMRWRVFWRLPLVGLWVLLGVVMATVWVRVSPERAMTLRQQAVIRWWMRGLLRVLGVRLAHTMVGCPSRLWVANHISWLDIIVLMSMSPSRFLSKAEVASWPVFGWLARRAGTVFMQRGAGHTEQVRRQLADLIHQGDGVVFFPEGTSRADAPGRFHARLFALALDTGEPVTPVSLVYTDSQGRRQAQLGFVGDEGLMSSLLRLLAQPSVEARVHVHAPLSTQGMDRGSLRLLAESAVRAGWQSLHHDTSDVTQVTSDGHGFVISGRHTAPTFAEE